MIDYFVIIVILQYVVSSQDYLHFLINGIILKYIDSKGGTMKKTIIVVVFELVIICSLASYPIMGARSLAMGGTGVASVNNASAVFWNPGSLSFQKYGTISLQIDAGVDVLQNISPQIARFNTLGDDYDAFMEIVRNDSLDWDDIAYMDRFSDFYTKYRDILNAFDNNGVGTNVALATGVFTHIKGLPVLNLAIGVIGTSDIQFYSENADLRFSRVLPLEYLSRDEIRENKPALSEAEITTTIQTILDDILSRGLVTTEEYNELYAYLVTGEGEIYDSDIFGLKNNQSRIKVNGILLTEVVFSTALRFDAGLAKIGAGINFKVIKGYNYDTLITVDEISNNDENDDFINDKFKDPHEGSSLGIDLGVYAVMFEKLRMGLVLRNAVVRPIEWGKIEGKVTPPSYTPPTFARFGVAYDPIKMLTLTADVDITKLDGNFAAIRNVGIGMEARVSVLSLRAGIITTGGLNDNLDSANTLYTAGIGLDFPVVKIDLAAAIPKDFNGFNFDDYEDYPQRAAVSASVGVKF